MFSDATKYFINPSAISFTQAAAGAQYIIAAASSSAAIKLSGQIQTANADDYYVKAGGVIGYNDALTYRVWKVQGAQLKLQDNEVDKKLYIYVRLSTNPANPNGRIFLSVNNYDIDGWLLPADARTTEIATQQQKEGSTQKDSGSSFFVCLGSISAPNENGQREVAISTGTFDTNKQQETEGSGALDRMFKLDAFKTYIIPQLPFLSLTFKDSSAIINKVVDTFGKWKTAAASTTIATLSAITEYVSDAIEKLDDKFLRKDQDDSTPHTLSANRLVSDTDIEIAKDANVGGNANVGGDTNVEGNANIQGDLTMGDETMPYERGVAGAAIYRDEAGYHIQTDYLTVTKKMFAAEVEVQQVSHIGGQVMLTAASCTVQRVVPFGGGYRLLFNAKDNDGTYIHNDWKVGDQAYCKTFNITEGATENFVNQYYWRLVVGKGTQEIDGTEYHYIDVSKSATVTIGGVIYKGCDPASQESQVGDKVVLLGSQMDATRQGATILGGAGEMFGLYIFKGIDDFTLAGKLVDEISPSRVRIEANELRIIVGNETQSIEDYISEQSKTIVKELESFEIFQVRNNETPTLDNEPYISWTEEEKVKYSTVTTQAVYLNSDGRTWMFTYIDGTYAWVEFTDPYLLAAMSKAEEAYTNSSAEKVALNVKKELAEKESMVIKGKLETLTKGTVFTLANGDMYIGTYTLQGNGDYKPTITNMSGLLTSQGLAQIFAEGEHDVKAAITAYISGEESGITLSADRISISSSGGKTGLGKYWSIDAYGNAVLNDVLAHNVTVEGVINNLVNTIDGIDDERIIHEGSIYSLDVLRLGSIVYIDNINPLSWLYLPFYINENMSQRTYTKYGTGVPHLMTTQELMQLLGKRITIFTGNNVGINRMLYGCALTPINSSLDALNNGNTTAAMPNAGQLTGIALGSQKCVQLEFRAVQFYNSTKNQWFWGYTWVAVDTQFVSADIGWNATTEDE